jgi:hypothetical protein
MARHPSVTSPDIAQAIEQIARMSDLSAWVHGVMIEVLLVLLYVFTEFAWRRGITLPLVRIGLIAYFVGVLAMMGAAMVSGFVITQIASLTPHATDADLRISGQLLILLACSTDVRELGRSFDVGGNRLLALELARLWLARLWACSIIGRTVATSCLGGSASQCSRMTQVVLPQWFGTLVLARCSFGDRRSHVPNEAGALRDVLTRGPYCAVAEIGRSISYDPDQPFDLF